MTANRAARRRATATGVNPHRGEAQIRTVNGDYLKLKMTLNAVVEIEEAFECAIAEIATVLDGKPTMRQLRQFIGPLVRGGGATVTETGEDGDIPRTRPMTDEEVGALIDISDIGQAISSVVSANFAPDDDAKGEAPAPGNA